MIKQLEAKHILFNSIEELLAPESLCELLAKPVSGVRRYPMNGHSGLAGGHLSYVETNVGRLVLKCMSIESDWIMFSSDDRQCRSITLWQYGLLDQLLPHVEHNIIACSRDGTGWAILMHDLTGSTFKWDEPIAPEIVPKFLDAMARLHATFWNNDDLAHPVLGICSPATLLDQSALPMASTHTDYRTSPIPEWVREGWKALPKILEPDAYRLMLTLIQDPKPLFDALGRYPSTLLHGDYRIENFAFHLGCPILLDWQESAYSLMTIDLAWFVKHGYVHDVMSKVQAIDYYRSRLESYLGMAFEEADWQAMLALGFCFDALRSSCFNAFFYSQDENPERRRFNEDLVKLQGRYVQNAVRWF